MLERLRSRSNDESGFTLVELLVVMLIIGILAAIAIPAFFSQRDKGYDSDAKANARTVQTALETYAVDNGGKYSGANLTNLAAIEGTINGMDVAAPTVTDDTYSVTATSKSGNTFTITRAASGAVTNPCSTEGDGGCPTGGWG